VQIIIPLLDSSKEATLFAINKYPAFKDNVKYISNCPTEFIAIYDHSNDFNILNRDEYIACMQTNTRCVASLPKMASSSTDCAAQSFFHNLDKNTEHTETSDIAPFFFTSNDTTLYAVNEPHTLTFHCDSIQRAGPDHQLVLNGRGNFSNPMGCKFQTAGMLFQPSHRHTIQLDDPRIKPKFTISADIVDFPAEHPHLNIVVKDLTKDMLKVQHGSGFSYFTLFVGIILMIVILIVSCTFFAKFRAIKSFVTNMTKMTECEPFVPPRPLFGLPIYRPTVSQNNEQQQSETKFNGPNRQARPNNYYGSLSTLDRVDEIKETPDQSTGTVRVLETDGPPIIRAHYTAPKARDRSFMSMPETSSATFSQQFPNKDEIAPIPAKRTLIRQDSHQHLLKDKENDFATEHNEDVRSVFCA
jgi:hypothetical protein